MNNSTTVRRPGRAAVNLVFFLLFLLVIILLADADRLPVRLLGLIPRYDLFGHFFLYGILFCLIDDVFRIGRGRESRWSTIFPVGITCLAALAEELSQLSIAARTFSLLDLFFGIAGCTAFCLIRWKRRGRMRY